MGRQKLHIQPPYQSILPHILVGLLHLGLKLLKLGLHFDQVAMFQRQLALFLLLNVLSLTKHTLEFEDKSGHESSRRRCAACGGFCAGGLERLFGLVNPGAKLQQLFSRQPDIRSNVFGLLKELHDSRPRLH
jgi:hypothetical protein